MKRTRKWAFVAQEARRLADLGLSPIEIAQRIDVKRSTVQRWMAVGKLTDTRRGSKRMRSVTVTRIRKASEWAGAVRKDFALDATDEQLVTLAESALGKSLDPLQPAATQLAAMRTFQGLVKQLALVARSANLTEPQPLMPPRAAATRPVRPRTSGDPRTLLQAVK